MARVAFWPLWLLTVLAMAHNRCAHSAKATGGLLGNPAQNSNSDVTWKYPATNQSPPTAAAVQGQTLTPLGFLLKQPRNPVDFDERVCDIIAGNTLHFALNVGRQLSAADPSSHNSEIFSPLSVMSALSLLMLGAKGKSYQQLRHLIGLDFDSELLSNPNKFHEEFSLMLEDLQRAPENGSVRPRKQVNWRNSVGRTPPIRSTQAGRSRPSEQVIKIANGLFVQTGYSLNPLYSYIVKAVYGSELEQLDYQYKSREARDHINAWVNRNTFGKIPNIIANEISRSTNIIIASVLYFKGFWENSFFPRATAEDNFYQDGPLSVPLKVQMMATGGMFPFYDAKEYDCRIIGLPYRGNATTMYVIQPNNSTRQKLRELQQFLDPYKIDDMISKMLRKTTVMVFPKMHFTRSMNMKSMLQSLGITDLFVGGLSDLSLISGISKHFSSPQLTTGVRLPLTPQLPKLPAHDTTATRPLHSYPPTIPQHVDRFMEPALIFSRYSEDALSSNASSDMDNGSKKTRRSVLAKQEYPNFISSLYREVLTRLEEERNKYDSYRSDLFVDDIVHKVDFAVDEQGTEAAAATLTYLHRSGTDVVFRGDTPFLILIRHDPTKLPLFYGIINKPEL